MSGLWFYYLSESASAMPVMRIGMSLLSTFESWFKSQKSVFAVAFKCYIVFCQYNLQKISKPYKDMTLISSTLTLSSKSGEQFMRNKNNKHLGIEIDPELHYKLHYIAKYYGRSGNGQILFLIRQAIKQFEKNDGEIPYPPKEED